jgi:O-antigen/teichoic acid export membrane protein
MTHASGHPIASFGSQVNWLLAARTAAVFVTYAIPLVLVRRFDQSEFGLYKQAFLLVSTAVALLPLGFGTSAFYFLPRAADRRAEVVLNILVFQVLVGGAAGLTLLIWPDVVTAIFHRDDLVPYARLIAVVLFLGIAAALWESVIIANGHTGQAAVFFAATQVAKAVSFSVAALAYGTLGALLLAAAAQELLHLSVCSRIAAGGSIGLRGRSVGTSCVRSSGTPFPSAWRACWPGSRPRPTTTSSAARSDSRPTPSTQSDASAFRWWRS